MSSKSTLFIDPIEEIFYEANRLIHPQENYLNLDNFDKTVILLENASAPISSENLYLYIHFEDLYDELYGHLSHDTVMSLGPIFYDFKYENAQMSDEELFIRIKQLEEDDESYLLTHGAEYEKILHNLAIQYSNNEIKKEEFESQISELDKKYPLQKEYTDYFWKRMSMVFEAYLYNRNSISREIVDKYEKYIKHIFGAITTEKDNIEEYIREALNEDNPNNIYHQAGIPERPLCVRTERDEVQIYIDPTIKDITALFEDNISKEDRDLIIFRQLFEDCYEYKIEEWIPSYYRLVLSAWNNLKANYPQLAEKFELRGKQYEQYVFNMRQKIKDDFLREVVAKFGEDRNKIVSFYNRFTKKEIIVV